MKYATFDTSWGTFGLVTQKDRLRATFLPGPFRAIRAAILERFPTAVESRRLLLGFQRQVQRYFNGGVEHFNVDVDLDDQTPFRAEVLEACGRIPFGKSASYADLARAVGHPLAARAVGGAMACNPLPLVIPCHRVVRSDAALGGFSSPDGIALKERLLRLEGAWPPDAANVRCDVFSRPVRGAREPIAAVG